MRFAVHQGDLVEPPAAWHLLTHNGLTWVTLRHEHIGVLELAEVRDITDACLAAGLPDPFKSATASSAPQQDAVQCGLAQSRGKAA